MHKNEILDEIHRYREEYARAFDYDLRAIFDDLKHKELAHQDRLVRLPIKRQSNREMNPKNNYDKCTR
jgi:rubrerythrin